jgi:hypothetical protein
MKKVKLIIKSFFETRRKKKIDKDIKREESKENLESH